jgi:FKBP-type peptidyl-prolyl cis-trans isomerase FklB
MKIKGLIATIATITIIASSCNRIPVGSSRLKTENDTLSYAIAINLYRQLAADSLSLNPAVFAKAFYELEEGKPRFTDEESNTLLRAFFMKRQLAKAKEQAEMNKVLYKDWIIRNQEFLARNKERQGVIVTPSGLQYEVIKMGRGEKPNPESTVRVHYIGSLVDSSEFDSSIKRKEPAEFQINYVIRGWTEALQLMPVGSRFKLYIPDSLAYGAEGMSDLIKPFSTLVFDVELLEIVKNEKR